MTASMRRPTLASVVAVNPDVAFRELDGEMVLLDLANGTYFGLDHVGARIWTLIGERTTLGTVFETLAGEYEVALGVLEHDLLALVDDLCAKGLTRVVAGSA
jgi:Coenzyme PQQ synthesis protein D (PqqD)